jgi:hypothetical protein
VSDCTPAAAGLAIDQCLFSHDPGYSTLPASCITRTNSAGNAVAAGGRRSDLFPIMSDGSAALLAGIKHGVVQGNGFWQLA